MFYINFDFIIYYQKLEENYLILVISQNLYYFLSIYHILDSHSYFIYQKFVHNVKSHKIQVHGI